MKKIILAMIIGALILASGGVVLAQDLEKIPSPDQIKNFQVMKREGNSLFGIRLDKLKETSKLDQELEKISHPGEIKLFEKIKKIGNALWGIKKENYRHSILVKPVAAQCVKTAIASKDNALKAAISANSQSLVTAIDARSICQQAMLDKTTLTEQREANKLCLNAYQKSRQESNLALVKARNDAWKTYKDALKACSELQKETATTTEDIMVGDGEE